MTGVLDSKHFMQDVVNFSCPGNDVRNPFVHCSIGVMSDREAKFTSFDASRAILFKHWFWYLSLDI